MSDTTSTTDPIVPTPAWTAAVRDRYWRGIDRRDQRIRDAIDLHEQGYTYEQIAIRLGYESRMGPYFAVNYSTIAKEHAAKRAQMAQDGRNGEKRPMTKAQRHEAEMMALYELRTRDREVV